MAHDGCGISFERHYPRIVQRVDSEVGASYGFGPTAMLILQASIVTNNMGSGVPAVKIDTLCADSCCLLKP